MPGNRKYCLWLLLAVACCHSVSAQMAGIDNKLFNNPPSDSTNTYQHTIVQAGAPFVVRNIIIVGNKRTRPEIILREIPFKPGESFLLQVLVNKFEEARRQLMNTSLFHEVIVALKSFDGYNIENKRKNNIRISNRKLKIKKWSKKIEQYGIKNLKRSSYPSKNIEKFR